MIKRLVNHIEKVLIREKYCIIPLLGGFVREDIPAHYDDTNNSIVPPSSEIHFNESLTHQDGLLQQSYAYTYTVSMRRAGLMLEEDIKELRKELVKNRYVDLNSIGQISISDNGVISFSSIDNEINDCMMYGLSPINMIGDRKKNMLSIIRKEPHKDNGYIYFKINKKAINIAAAVLVAFITLLPLGEITLNNKDTYTAGISTGKRNNYTQPKVIVKNNQSTITTSNSKEIVKETRTNASDKEENIYLETNISIPYHVIVASDRNEKRLIKYLNELRNQGFNNTMILKSPSMNRIVAGSFATISQAQEFINTIQKKYNKFETAWVYKK